MLWLHSSLSMGSKTCRNFLHPLALGLLPKRGIRSSEKLNHLQRVMHQTNVAHTKYYTFLFNRLFPGLKTATNTVAFATEFLPFTTKICKLATKFLCLVAKLQLDFFLISSPGFPVTLQVKNNYYSVHYEDLWQWVSLMWHVTMSDDRLLFPALILYMLKAYY